MVAQVDLEPVTIGLTQLPSVGTTDVSCLVPSYAV